MKQDTTRTIFLVEILNGGHREAFMQLFAKALLSLGQRVVCIKPETRSISDWINVNCPEYAHNISYHELTFPKEYIDNSAKWQNVQSHLYLWYYYKKNIAEISKKYQLPVDLVFFNCIDGHLANYMPHQIVDLLFPYQWAGLYFHPNHLRSQHGIFDHIAGLSDVDYIFRSKNCIAVAIHDEGVVEGFSKRLNEKPVILFPETADITPPDPQNKIAKEIKEKANGRIVLGMIGLEPFKGSFEFMQLAKAADPAKYYFAFCGAFSNEWYPYFGSAENAAEFRAFKENLPEHCYWNTGFLEEGAEYNSVFNAFDIIFLVYRNFYSSSNRLTKAASFHRLIMSRSQYCVGEDVKKYHLGETVDDIKTDSMLAALEKLEIRIRNNDLPLEEWKQYAQKHSEAVLKDKFCQILSHIK